MSDIKLDANNFNEANLKQHFAWQEEKKNEYVALLQSLVEQLEELPTRMSELFLSFLTR